jgi:hypothetical protein
VPRVGKLCPPLNRNAKKRTWINGVKAREEKWGDRYDEVTDTLECEYQYARDLAYVSSRVQLSWRHDKLTFEHYST